MANFATDFHYKSFQIQADDGAFYSFTLVVQQVKSNPPIQAFLDAVSSESGTVKAICVTRRLPSEMKGALHYKLLSLSKVAF